MTAEAPHLLTYPQNLRNPFDVVGNRLAQELAAVEQKTTMDAGLAKSLCGVEVNDDVDSGALERRDADRCAEERFQPSMSIH